MSVECFLFVQKNRKSPIQRGFSYFLTAGLFSCAILLFFRMDRSECEVHNLIFIIEDDSTTNRIFLTEAHEIENGVALISSFPKGQAGTLYCAELLGDILLQGLEICFRDVLLKFRMEKILYRAEAAVVEQGFNELRGGGILGVQNRSVILGSSKGCCR